MESRVYWAYGVNYFHTCLTAAKAQHYEMAGSNTDRTNILLPDYDVFRIKDAHMKTMKGRMPMARRLGYSNMAAANSCACSTIGT